MRPSSLIWDTALALVLAGFGAWRPTDNLRASGGLIALAILSTLPLAVRRLYPVPVLAVVTAATVSAALAYQAYWAPGAVVALYTVAAHCQRSEAMRTGAAALLALALPVAYATHWEWSTLLRLAPFAAAWILGDNLRTRRAYLRAVEDRARQLEREQDANARRAAAEEQARIAREVHDVVAHNLSVIVVQATAADRVFTEQPNEARRAVRAIEETARQALGDLRRVLGVVRPGDGLAPQPGLSRLDDLVAQVRASGLDVDLEVVGAPRELPGPLELSAYRIVQEALTNTMRHAAARHASVRLRFDADALGLEVVDDGAGPGANGGPGRGLVGMRERAASLGGELEAGPGAEGGFRVAARLPLAGAAR